MTDKKPHHTVDSKRNSVWDRICDLSLGVFKNSSVRNKILFGFGIIALALGILGVISLTSLTNMRNQFAYVVQHDAKVIENAHELSKLIVDMETGQRGFIITGLDEFLEPYNNGVIRFKTLVEEEKNLVSDNPEQLVALETIRQLVKEWKNKAALPEIILARKVHQAEVNKGYLQNLLAKGEGKLIFDSLREKLDELSLTLNLEKNTQAELLIAYLAKDMVDRETGQRGFLITGKENFLEPYRNGRQSFRTHLWQLGHVIENNKVNNLLLKKINSLAKAWEDRAGEPEIAARRLMNDNPTSMADVSEVLQRAEGKRILDNIRAHLREFITVEQQLTSLRYQNASNAATFTFIITVVLVALGIVIAIGLGFRISSIIANPIAQLQDSADMIAIGNLDTNINIKSKDEIGNLANSMSIMRDNIKRVNQENERQKNKLNRTNKELEQFAFIASHDLQEPLRTVMSFTDLLKEDYQGKADDNTYKYIQFISQSTTRMSALIKGLLDYSQLGNEKELCVIDCGQVINEIRDDLSVRIKETNTILKVDELPQVRAGNTELRLLFQNLINNAIKFQKKNVHPEINITAKREFNHWRFAVQDNGIGIAPEHLAKIFSIFQRLHNRKEYEGTGIGLAHCQKIVDLLGGKIWVESELDKGSTFYFTIPN